MHFTLTKFSLVLKKFQRHALQNLVSLIYAFANLAETSLMQDLVLFTRFLND